MMCAYLCEIRAGQLGSKHSVSLIIMWEMAYRYESRKKFLLLTENAALVAHLSGRLKNLVSELCV